MRRETWSVIKQSKQFYIHTFRRVGDALICSVILSILLSMVIGYVYFNQSENYFYSTDGVTPPIKLTSMKEPNYTATALLANDQRSDDKTHALPQ